MRSACFAVAVIASFAIAACGSGDDASSPSRDEREIRNTVVAVLSGTDLRYNCWDGLSDRLIAATYGDRGRCLRLVPRESGGGDFVRVSKVKVGRTRGELRASVRGAVSGSGRMTVVRLGRHGWQVHSLPREVLRAVVRVSFADIENLPRSSRRCLISTTAKLGPGDVKRLGHAAIGQRPRPLREAMYRYLAACPSANGTSLLRSEVERKAAGELRAAGYDARVSACVVRKLRNRVTDTQLIRDATSRRHGALARETPQAVREC